VNFFVKLVAVVIGARKRIAAIAGPVKPIALASMRFGVASIGYDAVTMLICLKVGFSHCSLVSKDVLQDQGMR
jgi:hypothetical protein